MSQALAASSSLLGLRRRDVANRAEHPSIVEPVERGQLDGLLAAPRAAPMDRFRFIQSIRMVPSTRRGSEGLQWGIRKAPISALEPGGNEWIFLWSTRKPQAQTGGDRRLAFIYPAYRVPIEAGSGLHDVVARFRPN